MKVFFKLQDGLSRLSTALAAATLLALTLLLLAETALRGFGRPLPGVQELAEMGMVLVIFGTLAQSEAQDGQIKVDLLAQKLGPRGQRLIARISALLAALLWAGLAVALCQAAMLSLLLGLKSNLLNMPRAPFQLMLAGFAGLGALAAGSRLFLAQRGRHE